MSADAAVRPAGPAPGKRAVTGLERPEQLRRLGRFRAQHPGVVIIRVGDFDFWQAWIPEGNGGTVITRYVLQDLLDKLDDLHAPATAEGPPPDRAHSQPGGLR
jgi:hypothetical protein